MTFNFIILYIAENQKSIVELHKIGCDKIGVKSDKICCNAVIILRDTANRDTADWDTDAWDLPEYME